MEYIWLVMKFLFLELIVSEALFDILKYIPPSFPNNFFWESKGEKAAPCWSAWAYPAAKLFNALLLDHLEIWFQGLLELLSTAPLIDLNKSIPPTNMVFELLGSLSISKS